jgi:Domain of unknown function (DUF4397)
MAQHRAMVRMARLPLALLATVAPLATIGWTSAASAAPAPALIRAAHFSPTTPGVDVYLTPFDGGATTTAWLSGVTYGTVSNYETLAPGTYTVSMRLAGASPATKPALSWILDARAGAAYTIAGVGSGQAVRGVVIPDQMTTPKAGDGLVRVIQAASRAPSVNVLATGGTVIADDAQFATVTNYTNVPAGIQHINTTSTSDPALTTTLPNEIKSGQVNSVLVLDAPTGGITTRVLLDAAGASVVPVGAVDAGGGGTATTFTSTSHSLWLPVAGAVLGLLLVVIVAFVRRPAAAGAAGRHLARTSGRHVAS